MSSSRVLLGTLVVAGLLSAACSRNPTNDAQVVIEPTSAVPIAVTTPGGEMVNQPPLSSSQAPMPTNSDVTTSSSLPPVTDVASLSSANESVHDVEGSSPVNPLQTCLDSLSVDQKAALLVWPAVYVNDWGRAQHLVHDVGVGGVLLMRPKLGEQQLSTLISELDQQSQLGVLIATDEEGGEVQRLREIEPLASQYEVSSEMSPDAARALIANHATVVARVGVDVVLGPVVDVLPVDGEPALQKSRFFNGGPDVVTAYASSYIDGWESGGLVPTLKHFPGHGSASGDTHHAEGRIPSLDLLETRDIVPYRELSGRGAAVMIGHLKVPDLTGDTPASSSPAAITYLRSNLGYEDALVISDALDMEAAGGPIPVVAVSSIAAGVDAILFTATEQTETVVQSIVDAVKRGEIPQTRLDSAAGHVISLQQTRGGGCSA